MAGVLHALFVLLFILLLAPVASYLALPCLAAVLLTTAWRLLELEHIGHFLARAPWDDRVILAATTLLTVFVDLSVAIAVGVVLASMLFMHRMAETPGVHLGTGPLVLEDKVDGTVPRSAVMSIHLPPGVRVFDFRGPLFFGASARIGTVLKALGDWPKVLILRMREVPLIDATAIEALQEIAVLSQRHGCRIIIAGLQAQPREALHRYGFLRENRIALAPTSAAALEKARAVLGKSPRVRHEKHGQP
jgi:SulP family sulfate permease